MEVKYIVLQTNASNGFELGVQLDYTGSIYMVEPDKSFRFSNPDTANAVMESLKAANETIGRGYDYKILKETREEYTDGTINE
ncbi:hypothetical protein [Staphylococcus chromogenes]|uniref:hypothetical protein n=1 Tax=Staphylococcus chromogenes TaxID=46126 RepID=UPI002885C56B|nr:hypothetical protein [Staphylococcus chromogenes]MDT0670675.1 hypothetical protein [Staphylococcus chromogenes]MDU0480636.1 hypothetical protein [Staphylococcus chromogenes]